MKFIAKPCMKLFSKPRNNIDNYYRIQRHHVSILDRILRWNIIMTGRDLHIIALTFGQSYSTILRDFYHGLIAVFRSLAEKYLIPINMDSEEYHKLKGNGVFSMFKNVLYAADCIKVKFFF